MTEEQLHWITEQTEHAAVKATRRALRQARIGYLVLVLALVVISGWYTSLQAEKREQVASRLAQKTQDAATGSCNRVNLLRSQSNLSDLVIFKILSAAGRREISLALSDVPATRAAHRKSAETYINSAQQVTMTALTDCPKAVSDPLHYKQPLAQPIGDPATGLLYAPAKKVASDSENQLHIESLKP